MDERRAMAFARYGLTSAPGDPPGKPQQYVIDAAGNWTMNCLACHQGKVAGQVVPGMPNTQFALQSLADDVRTTKMRLKKRLVRMDLSSAVFPLGTTHGTTNAVMFGVALMAYRDPQLNVVAGLPSRMVHHDHDAPAWWNFQRKSRLYADGFAEKGHRPLMQFMLTPENGPEKFQEWEADFQDVYAWLSSLEAPKYPFAVDKALAAQGEAVFKRNCADCHGSYGDDASYPNKIVSIEEVGTDPVRLQLADQAPSRRLRGQLVQPFWRAQGRGRPGRLRRAAAQRHLGLGPLLSQRQRADVVARAAPGRAARGLDRARPTATTRRRSAWRPRRTSACRPR